MPNCIGFIDETHIGLSFLPNGDKDYINRKGYPSIQLQLVVDDKMMIRDTYVGGPAAYMTLWCTAILQFLTVWSTTVVFTWHQTNI